MTKRLLLQLILVISTAAFSQTVSIDFSNNDTVSNQVGFLQSVDQTNPADSLIAQTRPNYWRGGLQTSNFYSRVTSTFKAKFIIIASEFWGYPPSWTPPYNDTTVFKIYLDTLCARTAGLPMIYDIWNEPNTSSYWVGGDSLFFETFKISANRIRQNLGIQTEIAGPAIVNADTAYFRKFCDYCLANNVRVDVFTFHWFYNDLYTFALKDALLWIRTNIIDNPTYAPLQIKKIVVDEIVPEQGQYSPGFNFAHFYYLEKGKADGSCRAAWNAVDGSGTSNYINNTLNGLLSPTSFQKRAVWWTTKIYADLDSIRYADYSSNARVVCRAGNLLSNPNTIRAMFGYYHNLTPLSPITLSVSLKNLNQLANFPSSHSIDVTVYKISNTGFSTLSQPTFLAHFRTANNSSTISFPSFPLDTNAVVYADIVSVGNTTAMGGQAVVENILVYPNPAQHSFIVEFPQQNFGLSVQNLTGQILYEQKDIFAKAIIDCKDFPNGIYFIHVTTDKQSFINKKIIITPD